MTFGSSQHPGSAFVFDDATLRPVPVDRDAMTQQALLLESRALTAESPRAAATMASTAAALFAMLGALDRAEALLRGALRALEDGRDGRALVVARIRFAQVRQFQGHLSEATSILQAVVESCRASEPLHARLDFALQHLGKVLFERRLHADALACLTEALTLREAQSDPELIRSTRLAIMVVSKRQVQDDELADEERR